MKKILFFAIVLSLAMFGINAAVKNVYSLTTASSSTAISYAVDTYDFTMKLYIPKIYDNTESLGYRRYQMQLINGKMLLTYGSDGRLIDTKFTNMVNKTHIMSNGKNVTYEKTYLNNAIQPRFNAIGSNKTKKFNTASVCFYLAAEPSYNIGEFDEDNALYVLCAGKGTFNSSTRHLMTATGYVAGTLGCGCMAYGHISPTRKITFYGPGDDIDDVAAVFGIWKIKYLFTQTSM